jgi:uncharacterized protein (TIGR00369 family)
MADGGNQIYGRVHELSDGPFKGWLSWYGAEDGDPFETHIGPLCFKVEPDGRVICAFQPRREHLNGAGALHGGALMSFADFSLFAIAHNALKGSGSSVTLTMNSEFIAAGKADAIVYAEGEVLKQTRSLLFVRGLLKQEDKVIFAFSGTLKKLGQ